MKWKSTNIPLPEAYLFALLAGVIFHLTEPRPITGKKQLSRKSGALALLTGILLGMWSVSAAGDKDLANQEALITGGPYRFSRNPMYLGWTFISAGLALIFNSLWMLAALPFAFLYLHLVGIPGEEAKLAQRFGQEFQRYRRQVHRYL